MTYTRDPVNTAWMHQPWTCPKCSKVIGASGKGTHLKWCEKREAHFWAKVDKNAAGGCWLYNGTISFEGYGYVNIGGGVRRKQWQAHRFAWTLLKGPIDKGACILHTCDVRNCVNPEHLYVGDRKDNARDKIRRRRDIAASLTYEQAAEIKAALANYRFGLGEELAVKYGVTRNVISGIKRGKTYAHVLPSAAHGGDSK